jgi:predicted RNase H-like HicB family nuclease
MKRTLTARIYPGDISGYVAECLELPVVTQGASLDETVANVKEAVVLHLEGEDLAKLGLEAHPSLILLMETEPLGVP